MVAVRWGSTSTLEGMAAKIRLLVLEMYVDDGAALKMAVFIEVVKGRAFAFAVAPGIASGRDGVGQVDGDDRARGQRLKLAF